MTILDEILATKRGEVEARKRARPLAEVVAAVVSAPGTRGFAESLARDDAGMRIIAEVKKASPSKGVIREDFDPVLIARAYDGGGAAAISVLTDESYFQGRLEFLEAIRAEVSVPLLRKDFIIDLYQVYEARAAGADAILLILAALDDDMLGALSDVATHLDMDVLWEVHDVEEARRVRQFSPRVVGVNNRDLRTFHVSLETTREAISELPEDALIVSESGFFERSELEMMREWGVGAFLIGESLMRADDPEAALRVLVDGAS
jgi:indole-3-glycerol phosphate synthase